MQATDFNRVFKNQNQLYTENLDSCKGIRVYGEKLINYKKKELRSWNPYRSKLAAAILNKMIKIQFFNNSNLLYLGAATGTTVSHISDMLNKGIIYAVENSPFAAKKLIQLSKKRENIIPIIADANQPEKYNTIVPVVDFIYQDISQRNQAEIFINNVNRYLKKNGQGIIMVKSRSINVSMNPNKIYELVTDKFKKHKFKVNSIIDISKYEKDHAAILIST